MKYKKLYDTLYDEGYHSDPTTNHTKKLYKEVKQYTPQGCRVLDIGCSHCSAVIDLREAGYDTFGVDIATGAIEQCTKRNFKNAFVSSAIEMPFKNSFFTTVVSSDTFEHLGSGELHTAIAEAHRVLEDKGHFIITVSVEAEKNRKFDKVAKKFGVPNLHTSVLPYLQWRTMFTKKFSIVDEWTKDPWATFVLKK